MSNIPLTLEFNAINPVLLQIFYL